MFHTRLQICDLDVQFVDIPAPELIVLSRVAAQACIINGFRSAASLIRLQHSASEEVRELSAMRAILLVISRWTKGSLLFLDHDPMLRASFGDCLIEETPYWLSKLATLPSPQIPFTELTELAYRFLGDARVKNDDQLGSEFNLVRLIAELVSLGAWASGGTCQHAAMLGRYMTEKIKPGLHRRSVLDAARFTRAFCETPEGAVVPHVKFTGAGRIAWHP